MADTIVAIATPAAPAGLGVLRLSGDDALRIAASVFRPARAQVSITAMDGYTAAYGHVFDAEGDIDDAIALVMRAPHSYTGEDTVELSCHGGLYILQRALRACVSAGARPATAGEYTRRAFINGKLDLTEAESVMSLIAADGALAARTALAAHEGSIHRALQTVRADLLAATAQLAAYVDYPDEDIPALQPDALAATLDTARDTLARLLATYDAGRVLREGVDTVIVGAPNVGKSTLMNALAGCERSIVTDIAGTTRDIIEDTVRLGDVTLRLADTAGIRQSDDAVESVGVDRARRRMQSAALVLAVFDGARALTDEDVALARDAAAAPAIAIINKSDQPQAIDRAALEDIFDHVVTISAAGGTGLDALTDAVATVTGIHNLTAAQPVLATERQRGCVAAALACIEEAADALAAGMTLDAVTVSIEGGIDAILQLTGERTTEAVVDEVFARFCVGK